MEAVPRVVEFLSEPIQMASAGTRFGRLAGRLLVFARF
jgi:hypothetical protein